MSNIILLIVAGSDTTRHSITGGLLALDQHPGEYARLRANPALFYQPAKVFTHPLPSSPGVSPGDPWIDQGQC